MGTETDDAQPVSSDAITAESVLGWLSRRYHVLAVAVIMLFMFWTRFQNFDRFTRGGDGFWLQGVDSWYHWRTINWTVDNFPWVMGFDPWTGFPNGTLTGQFGTVFDVLVATIALIIGLGSPGEQDVLLAALITVPALATLTAVPVYLMGRRVGTRAGGVAGVAFLALTAGTFFNRTTAGGLDHVAGEVFTMSVAVFAMMAAVRVGERERPIWELVVARNWSELRTPTLYSALAGGALTLYMWVWPPGIVLLGIFGTFFIIQLSFDYLRGRSPDHLAFVAIVSMAVTALLTATRIQESGFSSTSLDFLAPTLALLVAVGAGFMAWLARAWETQGLDRRAYPGAIAGAGVVALGVLALVLPDLIGTLLSNLTGRIIPFGYSPGALTVSEAQPPGDLTSLVTDQYGMGFYTAILGGGLMLVRPFFARSLRGEEVLVIVWSVFLISLAATQVRFNYYLPLGLAVLNAALVGTLVNRTNLTDGVDRLSSIETYQVLTVIVVALLLFAPLLPPLASATPVAAGGDPDREAGVVGVAPSGDAVKFEPVNEWMEENTPEVGNYAGAGNGGALQYTDQYGIPDGDTFDYPEGAYGVLSWWDYGHLITTQAERIPHANPFQQNARSASAVLTVQSEQRAELYLDAIAAGESPTRESDPAALREAVESSDLENGIQYVMIDDESAAGKFPAITEWTGPDFRQYLTNSEISLGGNQTQSLPVTGDAYTNSFLASLYTQDASGLEHFRLINEAPRYSLLGQQVVQTQEGVGYGGITSQVIAQGNYSERVANITTTATQARQAGQVIPGTNFYDTEVESSVKLFERVEGGTITGQTNATNGTVTAILQLETETDRPFQYRQSTSVENGTFELTVPYPTDETLGPEDGYANASVRMAEDAGGYSVFVQDQNNSVAASTENVTVDEETIQTGGIIEVNLEPFEINNGDDSESDNSDSSDSSGDDNQNNIVSAPIADE